MLEEINLSRNRIRLIEISTFNGNLPCLKKLDLSNNQILLLLGKAFISTSSLRHLDLRNNTLFYIDEK